MSKRFQRDVEFSNDSSIIQVNVFSIWCRNIVVCQKPQRFIHDKLCEIQASFCHIYIFMTPYTTADESENISKREFYCFTVSRLPLCLWIELMDCWLSDVKVSRKYRAISVMGICDGKKLSIVWQVRQKVKKLPWRDLNFECGIHEYKARRFFLPTFYSD